MFLRISCSGGRIWPEIKWSQPFLWYFITPGGGPPPVKSKFDLIIPAVWLLSCLGIWCHKHFLFRMGNPSQQCNCTKNSIYNANNKNVYWKLFYICIKQAINTYYWIVAHNNSNCYPKSIIFRTRFFKYHTLPNLTSVNTIYDCKVCRPFPLCSYKWGPFLCVAHTSSLIKLLFLSKTKIVNCQWMNASLQSRSSLATLSHSVLFRAQWSVQV